MISGKGIAQAMLASRQTFHKLELMNRFLFTALCLVSLCGMTFSFGVDKAMASESLSADTWYKVGMGHLKAKKFLSAGDAFHEAYKLAGDPALLYNAARSYEKAGKLEQAKKLYLTFTIQDGVEKKRKEKAIERIEAIDSQLMTTEHGRAAHLNKRHTPSGKQNVPWKWITIGSGLALAVSMGIMTEVAANDREDLANRLQLEESGLTSGVSQFDAYEIRDRANALDTAALITGIAGAAMLVTGVALWVVDDDESNVSIIPTKQGLMVSTGGQF